MKIKILAAAAACAAVAASSPAFAVTQSTVTDPTGDVKQEPDTAKAEKNAALPKSSIDISQYTVSYDSSSKKVFVKIHASDVAPVATKNDKKTVQGYSLYLPQSVKFIRVSMAAPTQAVTSDGIERQTSSPCDNTTVSVSTSSNTVVFAIPKACFGKDAKSAQVANVRSYMFVGSTFFAADTAKKNSVSFS